MCHSTVRRPTFGLGNIDIRPRHPIIVLNEPLALRKLSVTVRIRNLENPNHPLQGTRPELVLVQVVYP